MTQHPDEGTLHAYIDGELSSAEAATLELHVGECARCAAALAEARGFIAAASRVITTLDAAPSSVAKPVAAVAGVPAAPSKRVVRPPTFRVPYARAAALLLLVGGTAFVVDRTGTFAREKSPQAESLPADAATASEIVAEPTAESPTAAMPASAPAATADLSTEAGGGTADNAARDAVAPPRVVAGRETDGAKRARVVERSAPPPESARTGLVEQRGVAGGMATKPPPAAPAAALAGKDAAPTVAQPTALPVAPPALPPPVRPAMRLEEVVVTSAPTLVANVSRYRTKAGTVLTLTEELLRTSFAEESGATRQRAAPQLQQRAAAPMAAPVINSYRWSSPERGTTYTLSGPLTVAELEALSRRLSELERVP